MKKYLYAALAALPLAGASVSAQAIPVISSEWTDPVQQKVFLTQGQTHSYTHDITDDGFDVGTDHAWYYQMAVDLFDDHDRRAEWAKVDMPGVIGDAVFLTLGGDEFGGWSFLGLFMLNATGTLDVTVKSLLGDFYVGDSVLKVWGYEPRQVEVPEPGTLALFSLALLPLAVPAWRRRIMGHRARRAIAAA